MLYEGFSWNFKQINYACKLNTGVLIKQKLWHLKFKQFHDISVQNFRIWKSVPKSTLSIENGNYMWGYVLHNLRNKNKNLARRSSNKYSKISICEDKSKWVKIVKIWQFYQKHQHPNKTKCDLAQFSKTYCTIKRFN